VAKARASGHASQTARELGISYKSLLRWQKEFKASELPDETATTSADLAARVQHLERELAIREQQLEVLKKAISIVSQPEKSDLQ
jgi:transposase-like protein